MALIIFILILCVLAVTDLMSKRLPNIIVLPAIAAGLMLTGNWIWAGLMFALGCLFYSKNAFAGGDVKLLAMCGAFLGFNALPAFIVSFMLLTFYRAMFNRRYSLPFAPFVWLGSLFFLK